MKKKLRLGAFIFTLSAILLTVGSNVQLGRNIYKNIFTKQLGRGIHKLFHSPSKYRSKWIAEHTVPNTKLFCLQKRQNGFEELKKIILDNYYKTQIDEKLDYEVKAIMLYQSKSTGEGDHQNPIFNERRIYFIPETSENESVDFEKNPAMMLKNEKLITTQKELTKNLDTFFTNRIALLASMFLIVALALDVKIWKMKNKK